MRSQLLLQSPLPSMSKVFSLLLQEESQRSLSNVVGISIDSHAMNAAQTQRSVAMSGIRFTKPKIKGNVTCSHCGCNGHLADKCFHLIGYPPGWKGSRGKKNFPVQQGNTNTNLPMQILFLLWSQIQQMLLLHQLPNKSSMVYLPNGHSAPVVFTRNNLISWKMIGLAKVKSSLYYLQQPSILARSKTDFNCAPSVPLANTCKTNADIWHLRLGHIPPTRLKIISEIDSNVSAPQNHICEVCPLAKQKKIPFPMIIQDLLGFIS
ncbi:uncharacterized protein LOC131148241 [Malania oleifera]|uniref:uncharacterized protein LOC131148241 n=1 Tax=Malania oleifera TaxID=397392 RepID=UPI0025AEBB00|nr:uncharacterized protein LOC131148241 [Malania oleifera]